MLPKTVPLNILVTELRKRRMLAIGEKKIPPSCALRLSELIYLSVSRPTWGNVFRHVRAPVDPGSSGGRFEPQVGNQPSTPFPRVEVVDSVSSVSHHTKYPVPCDTDSACQRTHYRGIAFENKMSVFIRSHGNLIFHKYAYFIKFHAGYLVSV